MADASVIIPTIGRPERLRACLESLARCEPRPSEVIVIDQSGAGEVAALVDEFAGIGARRIACERRGVGHARNVGLINARHQAVLMTDDDCTVADSWVGEGTRLVAQHQGALITGAVMPGEESPLALSTKVDPDPQDFTGDRTYGVLYTNNAAATRSDLVAFGGFDERLPTAEDNDLCYRWLRAGRTLRYEPSFMVWHNDRRSPAQLRVRYREYWRGQGAFYGKHLRARDRDVLRFLGSDARFYVRRQTARLLRGREASSDFQGFLRGLVPGLGRGLFTLSGDDGLSEEERRDGDET